MGAARKRLWGFVAIAVMLFSLPVQAAWEDSLGLEQAKGAVLIEAARRRISRSIIAAQPLANASTTKIMTALLTLEQPNLDESFAVDADAVRVEGSSMGLAAGDQVTLRTLAWGCAVVGKRCRQCGGGADRWKHRGLL